jgi:hypothetical protein
MHGLNYRPTHLLISSLYIYKSVRFLVSFVACVVGFLVSLVVARFVLHVFFSLKSAVDVERRRVEGSAVTTLTVV